MGGALLTGLLAGTPAAVAFRILDKDSGRARALADASGDRVQSVADPAELTDACDPIIVSVKPQDMDTLVRDLSASLRDGQTVVSTAAGVTLQHLRAELGPGPRVFRIMPNLAVAIQEGAVALAPEEGADDPSVEDVRTLFSCLGTVEVLAEKYFDVVTAVAGSGPGFLAVVVEGLEDGAVRSGLPRDVARAFVRQTTLGTARLLMGSTESAAELKDRVSSPGGTTIAGLAVLEDRGVRGALVRAVEEATERGKQLRAEARRG
jgi:pyrroline-5-carboxylate reductase